MSTTSDPVADRLFSGGGEMAELMRTTDWASTPLGTPDRWPQSLRTVVRILLTSRFAMWMGWGSELTFLYNDAYRVMTLGAKHPGALGRPAREVWAEIWPQIGPRIDRVLTTGEATWDERLLLFLERSGYREETYHTFSYSPLPGDDGRIQGHLCVVTEETERVIDERRLRVLKELGAHLAAAQGVGDVLEAPTEALATDARDLPFTLIYQVDENRQARLAASSGLPWVHPAVPASVSIAGLGRLWSIDGADALESPCVTTVPAGAGWSTDPWETPIARAFVLPMRQQGQSGASGWFIGGVNPYRQVDEKYQSFVTLFAGQLAAGLANARAYEEERRRGEALLELDRAKTAFFSNVSHEFRTPLTLMLGPTEDALATPARALTGDNLETVYRNELRLLRLVNALLDFSRIEAGRARARFEPVDLSALTVDLTSAFRSAVERGGLSLIVDCAPLPEPMYVDRQMWEKIVLNLLSNAFKFTFEGAIRVSLRADPNVVTLTVADTGVGIPAGELPRVFERFHRIEGTRARTHEGSGIGLALVHELVSLHGGQIGVDSEPGRGTTFTVTVHRGHAHLPADRIELGGSAGTATVAESYVAEAERWLPRTAGAGTRANDTQDEDGVADARQRILVVDDNADMREYLTRLLEPHWAVDVAGDGVQALEVIAQHPPSLVLSDVMMPNLDGFGLLRALRSDLATVHIPIVMLSARAGEEARIDGLEAGADDYLVKPFSARELVATVKAHLMLADARRDAAARENALTRQAQAAWHQMDAILQSMIDGFVVYDSEWRFTYVNEAAATLLGHPATDLLGRVIWDVFPQLADAPAHEALVDAARHQQHVRFETRAADSDRWYEHRVYPATGGMMNFFTDVTERKALEDERRTLLNREHEARQTAESASRAKDEFLAMLGHELRNPLAPILTALHLMQLRGSGQVERERAIIERQTKHLVRLVDDLLDVSRIARGKIELNREHMELASAVAKAIELASPLFEARQQTLDVWVPAAGLVVDADPGRLAQAITNLLTNAAKYTDRAGHVTIHAFREGTDVVLRVKDTGIGIQPGMLPHVFDMFVQGRQALDRSQGGLGLGLTIVRNIMSMHGGSAAVRSDGPGRGSEFELRLPEAAPLPGAPADAAEPAGASPAPERGELILIVDDNQDAAELLAESLAFVGHETRVAHDAPSALRLIREFVPRVALLDIGLPGMDGYDLAAALRLDPRLAGLRIVAITGYGQEADRRRTEAAGFDAHLVKPIDVSRLDVLVRQLSQSTP